MADGSKFPSNVIKDGDVLRVKNAVPGNSGTYKCTAHPYSATAVIAVEGKVAWLCTNPGGNPAWLNYPQCNCWRLFHFPLISAEACCNELAIQYDGNKLVYDFFENNQTSVYAGNTTFKKDGVKNGQSSYTSTDGQFALSFCKGENIWKMRNW